MAKEFRGEEMTLGGYFDDETAKVINIGYGVVRHRLTRQIVEEYKGLVNLLNKKRELERAVVLDTNALAKVIMDIRVQKAICRAFSKFEWDRVPEREYMDAIVYSSILNDHEDEYLNQKSVTTILQEEGIDENIAYNNLMEPDYQEDF